jgi:dTDP-4-amino-4,6-dideoxygalactose transaminase
MIPYGKHLVDEQDIDAVVDVLRNQFLTQGSIVPKFEQALCEYTGCQYATAVNSATSGLHVACLAAGVGQGDIVWTVPNSFVASANCALYCGANINLPRQHNLILFLKF